MKFSLFLILIFSALATWGAPKNPEAYIIDKGPFLNLQNGSILQGSVIGGGTQPDYIIDMKNSVLQKLWIYSERIGQSELDFWEKIMKIEEYINKKVLIGYDYDHPAYTQVINSYRKQGIDIPISAYAICQAGVCRENGILLHLALKKAGIENYYVYAKIHRTSQREKFEIIEDHAFSVVTYRGEKWVADSYYWGFNGFLLKDLTSSLGITAFSRRSPIALSGDHYRKIIEFRNYPAWHPRPTCSQIHH